jgi:hypothetical protein
MKTDTEPPNSDASQKLEEEEEEVRDTELRKKVLPDM